MLKLAFRTVLLVAAVVLFAADLFQTSLGDALILAFWTALAAEMLHRLIPGKHYKKSISNPARLHKGAALSALAWLVITAGVLLTLYFLDALTPVAVLIIALAYAVSDMIFIIFFCPFQKFFMKNRCCETCRIHDWDYFMMCAPLILFPSVFSISLFVLSAAVLLRWELSLPRDKSPNCKQCKSRLCHFKP
ncbi:MAG: hypothetical protein FWB91_14680 [Defluviitaleaceae bacterium]|nr:hypothetical protein [Defluviitaleaceae bacterium]